MDKEKALELALAQIDKQFGKGAIMRLGQAEKLVTEAVPTGSVALDIALGVGGIPKGRITEVYGPGVVGQDDPGPAPGRRVAEDGRHLRVCGRRARPGPGIRAPAGRQH